MSHRHAREFSGDFFAHLKSEKGTYGVVYLGATRRKMSLTALDEVAFLAISFELKKYCAKENKKGYNC
jgi:hypothetical protein